jgi:integrase
LIAESSSHPSHASKRRGRVDGCPGLWWRRRADGSIVFEIKLRQNGVLHSTTLPKGTTERQARTAWKKASSQRDEGARPLSQNVTLAAVAEQALADLEARVRAGTRSERTIGGYRSHWSRYIEPALGRKKVSRLEARDILTLIANLRTFRGKRGKSGLAEWTVANVITCLRMILRFGRHAGYTTNDPFSVLSPDDLPQQRARESFEARVLRPTEMERLLASTTPMYRNVVTLLAFSGLRVSEAAGLMWADIDLVERVLHVRKQLAPLRRGEEPRRVKTKSRASVREVPLLDRVYEALLAQLLVEQSKGLGTASDFVFTSETGRPIDRHRLSKRGVARAAEKAGLGHVTAQTLRRSVATATAHAMLPVVVAAAMTGHSKQVYDAHYAKPFRDAEERDRVRESLASIGFGSGSVDQKLTRERPWATS